MTALSVPAVELLEVDNYATWRSKMKFLLITKGLWSAVCTSARAAWEQLETLYQAKSNARKRQLRKELSQLRMGAAEPLAKYVARAKEIQNQLRAAGYEVGDQEVAWAPLAGLPPAFETVVTVLETSTTEDMKLNDILPKLMPVEQRMYSPESQGPGFPAVCGV
ncbi:hypothetical protein N2152v2_002420 [Parachlorella kessleri]